MYPVNAGITTVRFQSRKNTVAARLKIGGFPIGNAVINGNYIVYKFDPALLMPGKYTMELHCRFSDGTTATDRFPIEIVKEMRRWSNVQVNAWHEYKPGFEDAGLTIAYGRNPDEINARARVGLYSNFNLNYFGTPRPDQPEDFALNSFGKRIYADIRSDYVKKDIVKHARMIAEELKDAPTFKAIVLNSEMHTGGGGETGTNLADHEIKRVKQKFGLDLNRWRLKDTKTRTRWASFHPGGYLNTNRAPELVPSSYAIPSDNPIYAYLRDRHSSNGGTEVVSNDLMAETFLAIRPDLFMMQDPIMRRPALQSYRKVNIAQDWFYYPELTAAVSHVEGLGAVTRGMPHMSSSAMPQFLFKAGMAAPFNGLPPRDMFREAVYIVASRPMHVITFWNTGRALNKGKSLSPEELIERFGDGDYAATAKAIKEQKAEVYCQTPGLKDEFVSLSNHLWLPFGALMPQWKNAPRRVALVNSFASSLFGNIRWPNYGVLGNALMRSGLPFDVLYDNDIEKGIGNYDVVVIPNGYALPEKAVQHLNEFAKRGGVIIADEKMRVRTLKKYRTVSIGKINGKELIRKEQELLRQYKNNTASPGYIEGMQELQREAEANVKDSGLGQLLKQTVKTDFLSENKHIFWNHLQASGADYLFVVNDLRIPGKIYGRFGKIREQGVAQKVTFTVRNPKFHYAYDLMSNRRIELKDRQLSFDLPPCGGRIILFTQNLLGKFLVNADKTVSPGKILKYGAKLVNGEGLIPVRFRIVSADKKTVLTDFYTVLKNGKAIELLTIPLNAPTGKYTVYARELATGKVNTCEVSIKK